MSSPPSDTLTLPLTDRQFLEPHLPPPIQSNNPSKDDDHSSDLLPFTTLTFATSLDSSLALAPGTRTILSGPQSKAMTHYLRSRHDAILIGVGTAIADDPGLNCRIAGVGGYGGQGLEGQPQPIIVDPCARWRFGADAKILELVRQGRGRAPFVVIAEGVEPAQSQKEVLEGVGGRFIALPCVNVKVVGEVGTMRKEFDWRQLLGLLRREEGIRSVMVEGGGSVINSLLQPQYQGMVSSVIVTIAPTWLGQGGVVVCPPRTRAGLAVGRLRGVKWYPFGEDVVLCGRFGEGVSE
ncbi:RibD family protein [Aspergillus saccharolyticus JOP 1030-1]|uniref:2,5-diamino-6-ribosylamino-4(3H)-pyrimidinone 5'-phosphate reductase n=1 Tax=Aspergillus saccharolyticus JOP 1030-1 TaxID=1450539 RepID=A0A319AIG1_9EURO|nr:bacterial bifunctional deaminase-reductase [Aspergillus saccharolyticus JOP 1030-1]PYH46412.1 bacterial bifunctional deaminase-reductase [Aspergillus saccharolyticus JOP 1030-1]